MIYFIAGFFFGSIAAMMLYSIVVSGRINNLEDQNEVLMHELEQKKRTCEHTNVCIAVLMKDLRACVKRRLNNEWWKLLLYV